MKDITKQDYEDAVSIVGFIPLHNSRIIDDMELTKEIKRFQRAIKRFETRTGYHINGIDMSKFDIKEWLKEYEY